MGKYIYRVRVVHDLSVTEWDGDASIDPGPNYSPFRVTVIPECICCHWQDEERGESVGSVWLSQSKRSDTYLRSVIRELIDEITGEQKFSWRNVIIDRD